MKLHEVKLEEAFIELLGKRILLKEVDTKSVNLSK